METHRKRVVLDQFLLGCGSHFDPFEAVRAMPLAGYTTHSAYTCIHLHHDQGKASLENKFLGQKSAESAKSVENSVKSEPRLCPK